MVGFLTSHPARALCLGLAAAALTACASTPAPISAGGYGRAPAVDRLPEPPGEDARVTD